ncbi:MAG: 4Fe-4S dicluster domain-containing protein [Planctomycetota bacterium]
MTRWAMVIDLDRCTACQACTIACRAENNVPVAGPEGTLKGQAILWHDFVVYREGEYPRVRVRYIPRPCMHCENSPCIKVCPANATYKNEEGIVAVIWNRCIGCRLCLASCPYGARQFNWFHAEWPEQRSWADGGEMHKVMDQHLNPEVSVRCKGVVEKCTFCHQRLRAVKEQARRENRPLRDEELVQLPACCQTCPSEARYFGDLDDPESTVSKLAKSSRAFHLLEELGTRPKVFYLAEGTDA